MSLRIVRCFIGFRRLGPTIGPHQSVTMMVEPFAAVQLRADLADLHIASVTTMEPVNLPEHYGTVAFSGRAAESA